jgi:hypothetical protein
MEMGFVFVSQSVFALVLTDKPGPLSGRSPLGKLFGEKISAPVCFHAKCVHCQAVLVTAVSAHSQRLCQQHAPQGVTEPYLPRSCGRHEKYICLQDDHALTLWSPHPTNQQKTKKFRVFWDAALCSRSWLTFQWCVLPPSSGWPWWWRQYEPLKRRSTSTWLHGATS